MLEQNRLESVVDKMVFQREESCSSSVLRWGRVALGPVGA